MPKYKLISPFSKDPPAHYMDDFYEFYLAIMDVTGTPASQEDFAIWFCRCVDEGLIVPA